MPCISSASPWVAPNDITLRQHIQVLSDANIIRVPITTYPLMWSGIAKDIERYASSTIMTQSQRYSLAYVRHELDRAQQATQKQIGFNAASKTPILNGFGDISREQISMNKQLGWMGDSFAGELNVTSVLKDDSQSADHSTDLRLDGSYITALLGNWALAIGSIDRWWGPAQSNSLILSTNARPAPGIMLQRNYSDAFESRWLSWIGPWQLTAFANQLEKERHIPRTKLLGMRFSFKPLNSLEVGLSRTAQWGGKNRRENLSTFKNLLIGADNGENGENVGKDEPGNQLAGFDWRWNTSITSTHLAFYGQYIGEDEAGFAPAKSMILLGLSTRFDIKGTHHNIAIETLDTHCDALSDSINNCAYEHHLYKTGYRYFGRSIAAAMDNDSKAIILIAQHTLSPSYTVNWSIADYRLNQDGASRTSLPFSPISQKFLASSIGITHTRQNAKIKLEMSHFNKTVTLLGQKQRPFTLKASLLYRY